MLKKTITYTDYDGNERTEDFYFNLSQAELIEMESSVSGGFDKQIRNIIASPDTTRLMSIFSDIVKKAYGVKTPDGRRFIKSKEVVDEFVQTEAYSDLFTELATNSDEAEAFIKGILPAGIVNGIIETK